MTYHFSAEEVVYDIRDLKKGASPGTWPSLQNTPGPQDIEPPDKPKRIIDFIAGLFADPVRSLSDAITLGQPTLAIAKFASLCIAADPTCSDFIMPNFRYN